MKRIYSFDVLKFIATICIMFHHFQIYTGVHYNNGLNFVGGRYHFEYLVELFFIISGFFSEKWINTIVEGGEFGDFFVPKYVRFLGPQITSVLSFAVLDVVYEYLYKETFFDRHAEMWGIIVSALGFSQGWGLIQSKMNGPIWYISALLICYIIFYIICFICSKLNVSPLWWFIFMEFLAFYVRTYSINWLFINEGTVRGISAYFWGLILGIILSKREITNRESVLATCTIFIVLAVLVFDKWNFTTNEIQYIYEYCLFTPLIVVVNSNYIKKIFCNKLFGWLGKISFEMYIWHFPLILLFINLNMFYDYNFYNRIWLFILFITTFIIAIISYYLVEQPFTKVSDKILKRLSEK